MKARILITVHQDGTDAWTEFAAVAEAKAMDDQPLWLPESFIKALEADDVVGHGTYDVEVPGAVIWALMAPHVVEGER